MKKNSKCDKCGATGPNLTEAIEGDSHTIMCRKCGNLMYTGAFFARRQYRAKHRPRFCSCCEKNNIAKFNTKGLCGFCRSLLTKWEADGEYGPPPLIEVLGVWVKNVNP